MHSALNMSGPVGSAPPIEVTLDGRTQPAEVLAPTRDPAAPRVVLRPANASASLAAGIMLGHGGDGVMSGRVTLRGLGVSLSGFGLRDDGQGSEPTVAGGVVAVRVLPSLTIDEGCAFDDDTPAAVSVIGGGGRPRG